MSMFISSTTSPRSLSYPSPPPKLSSSSLPSWPLATLESRPWASVLIHHPPNTTRGTRRGRTSLSCSLEPLTSTLQPPHAEANNNKVIEELIASIRDELASFYTATRPGDDPSEALILVDLIQRLGIQRHFNHHIQRIMQWTYMKWNGDYGMANEETTVLAFQLLRLHGYEVSPDVLEKLKDEKGQFSSFSMDTPTKVTGMLNLYRCSGLGFPSESKIMGEIKEFAGSKLQEAIAEDHPTLKGFRDEIKFAIEFPRRCHMSRLESRNIIRQLWPGTQTTRKYLELAKLDLNIIQKLHQQELKEAERWWVKQGFTTVKVARRKIENSLFSIIPAVFEPEFSAYRLAYMKISSLAIIVDDVFDDKTASLKDLQRFAEAVKRWDASALDGLPQLKLVFQSVMNTVTDMAGDSSKVQGQDLLPQFKDLFAKYVASYITEAEWVDRGQVPTFDEYLEVAHYSIGATLVAWTTIYLLGERMTDEMLRHIGIGSRFHYLVDVASRLVNDITGIDREAEEGKAGTAVVCYLRDNPGCTVPDAVKALRSMVENACVELEWELFQAVTVVPDSCCRAAMSFVRACCFFYRDSDSFTGHSDEVAQMLKDYLFSPI